MYGRISEKVGINGMRSREPSRPPTPTPADAAKSGAPGDEFVYSTSLRRVDPPAEAVGAGVVKALTSPVRRTSHGASQGHPYRHHHDAGAFAHTVRPSTPSAHYAVNTVEYTIQTLATHATQGLQSSGVPAIRALHGPNEFELEGKDPVWKKFLAQFYESPLNLLLLGSAAVSVLVGNTDDAISIAAAIIIVVTVGFVQEQRSEKSLEALNKLVPHYCRLIRDSAPQTLLANVLVPGDLVSFSVGDRVPADVRLIKANNLEIDESTMTGETKPARKSTTPIDAAIRGVPDISERTNTALMGTLVRSGNGQGIVVATGPQTEFGVVFSMMQEVEDRKTPLQLSMDELAKKLSAISFAVIGVICLIGVYQKRGWLEMFTIGVSLAVAAIPEGLPIVVTVTLALGVLRMAKRKAIVKKLPSVETLGSVSVICTDKTGTLTANLMTVVKAYTVDDGVIELDPQAPPMHLSEALKKTFLVGNLCSNAYWNREGTINGQSTEVALLGVLRTVGLDDARSNFTRKAELPFSSETKFSSVTGRSSQATADRDLVYFTGASDVILAKCKLHLRGDGSTAMLDAAARASITSSILSLAKSGLRVIGTAYGSDEDSLVFAGLQAITDPPRRGVAAAISSLQHGGVQIVMITGDAEPTAMSIARELGIRVNPASGCLTGKDIDLLSQRQLVDRIRGVSVFARVTPRHKMAIVEAFQATGAIVAMTGDGVNDAPSLRVADIGISMGKGATDVAKEAADVILVDDNFATILPAVEEGKSIFYNIQNFLGFQLSTAVAALSLITLSTALHMASPLNAMQILFINILMDGPPSQSLGVDPVNREVMRRPPRSKTAPVLTRRLLYRVAFSASMIVLGTLFVYMHELSDGRFKTRDQTMTFTSFVFLDLVSALQNRGLTVALLPAFDRISRRPYNKMLLLTVSVSFLSQLAIIYLPLLQGVFQTQALSGRDLGVLILLGATSFALHEGRRSYERQVDKRRTWEEDVV